MITGLFLIAIGVLIALYPQILVAMIAGFFIFSGAGLMIASWQFRRLRRQANSRFMNWIIRF